MYLLIALFSTLASAALVFLFTRIALKKHQSTFVEKPLTIFEMAATAGSQRFKQTMFMEHVSKGILKPVNVQLKNTKTNQLRWILDGSQGLAFSQTLHPNHLYTTDEIVQKISSSTNPFERVQNKTVITAGLIGLIGATVALMHLALFDVMAVFVFALPLCVVHFMMIIGAYKNAVLKYSIPDWANKQMNEWKQRLQPQMLVPRLEHLPSVTALFGLSTIPLVASTFQHMGMSIPYIENYQLASRTAETSTSSCSGFVSTCSSDSGGDSSGGCSSGGCGGGGCGS